MSNILFLITHFFLKRQTFWNDKMRSHERLENTVNQMLFFLFLFEPFFLFWNLFVLNFTRCFTAPSPTCKTSNLWLKGLGSQHSGTQVVLSKQINGSHPYSSGSKDVIMRGWGTKMSNLSILFSIVTVVYNNGINLKILMSH